ncbi:MAG TPA: hypothetical protein VGR18_11795 [Rubrobacter sp.]|nr:hypothetical protein [Rubrobacter sp.]
MAMLVLAPTAMAQDTTMMMGDTTMMMEDTGMMMEDTGMMEMTGAGQMDDDDLPTSGGPAILLPAAALLVGSGILTYAILRRR